MTTDERVAAAIDVAMTNMSIEWPELTRRTSIRQQESYTAWELHVLAKTLYVEMLGLLDGTVRPVEPMLWCEPRRPR